MHEGSESAVDPLELTKVLVSLLEASRPGLGGHSGEVGRLLARLGRQLGLAEDMREALCLAGLLHDLGKGHAYHLTPLNVAEYAAYRTQAQQLYLAPLRLVERVTLPEACTDALTHMYERVDGRGFPDGLPGEAVPQGACLLAIAETYADLTGNPRNPFRKELSPADACEVLGRYAGRLFDAALLRVLGECVLGDARVRERPRVMLVDAESEATAVLELRLSEQGFEVRRCHGSFEAQRCFEDYALDAALVEVDVQPQSGLELVEGLRQLPAGAELPVLFVTHRADAETVERGLSLGAVDYIVKPAAAELVIAKLRAGLARASQGAGARGVQGQLSEMPLPEVLQVLSRGRKTGRLQVRASGGVGEVHVRDGEVHSAQFSSLQGEEAVYELLKLEEGAFELEPGVTPPSREIHLSTEGLLLEGMRRLDESKDDLKATRVE